MTNIDVRYWTPVNSISEKVIIFRIYKKHTNSIEHTIWKKKKHTSSFSFYMWEPDIVVLSKYHAKV